MLVSAPGREGDPPAAVRGAALAASAGGGLLFGALGFVGAVAMLRRLRRLIGSWHIAGGVLGVMAGVFVLSSFVLGPASMGSGDGDRAKDLPTTTLATPRGHDGHHLDNVSRYPLGV